MALINGIYLEKLENDGLAVHQIARCLGRSTLDIGQLCGDVNAAGVRVYITNKWTLRKPQNIERLDPISDELRALYDYGFDTSVIASKSVNFGDIMHAARQAGFDWPYVPPTSCFRVLDFNGYNHNAQPPYKVNSIGGAFIPTEVSCIRVEGAEIKVEDMHAILALDTEYSPANFRLGVITQRTGTGQTRMFVSGHTLQDMAEEESAVVDNTEWGVPVELGAEEGTVQCLFVLTTLQADSDNGEVRDAEAFADSAVTVWLPRCLQTYEISAVTASILLRPADYPFITFRTTADSDEGTRQLLSAVPRIHITNGTAGDRQVSISLVLRFEDRTEESHDDVTFEQTYNILSEQSSDFELGEKDLPDWVRQREGFNREFISVKLSWNWNNSAYDTQYRYFDFRKGYPVLDDPDFVSLADIENSYTIITEQH